MNNLYPKGFPSLSQNLFPQSFPPRSECQAHTSLPSQRRKGREGSEAPQGLWFPLCRWHTPVPSATSAPMTMVTSHLVCARHRAKPAQYTTPADPPHKPWEDTVITPFYRQANRPMRGRHLPQSFDGDAGTWRSHWAAALRLLTAEEAPAGPTCGPSP